MREKIILFICCLSVFSYAQKTTTWRSAKEIIEYKGESFVLNALTNGQKHRPYSITFKNSRDNKIKTVNLLKSEFTPTFLRAKETELPRSTSIMVKAQDMTKAQKLAAINPKYKANAEVLKKFTCVTTDVSVNFDKEGYGNDLSGCIIIKYNI